MVLEHSSSGFSHVFLTPSATTSTHELEDPKPLQPAVTTMDVDQQHVIDEGYGTQMEADTEEDHEDGGVRLGLSSHNLESTMGEEALSIHDEIPANAVSEATLSPASNQSLTSTSTSPDTETMAGPTSTNPDESHEALMAMEAEMDNILPPANQPNQWWLGPEDLGTQSGTDLTVDFAELPLPDFDEIPFDEIPITVSSFLDLDWEPPSNHPVIQPGSFPILQTNPLPQEDELLDLAYMDDWDNQQSVPDRDHVHSVARFLRQWRALGRLFGLEHTVSAEALLPNDTERKTFVRPDDVEEGGNIQGIDWIRYGTTHDKARDARKRLYCMRNSISYRTRCQICSSGKGWPIRDRTTFFDFKQFNTAHIPHVEHWQLRNILTTTSQNDIFYASKSRIMHASPLSSTPRCIKNLRGPSGMPFNTTTLAAGDNLLLAGSLQGEYALVDLTSSAKEGGRSLKGRLSSERNGITNHVHLFPSRSTGGMATHALFASNDSKLRLLNCETDTILSITSSSAGVVNCAATSPDARLRIQVGDFDGSQIVDVVSGREVQRLAGNTGDAFACAWADDGVLVAVAGQDAHTLIFDARNWTRPVADMECEMDCARQLAFSPVGGGAKTLVVAESSDFVSIVDARTFDKRQIVECFGSIAGVSYSADGSELLIGNADARFGGILSFARRRHTPSRDEGSSQYSRDHDFEDWTRYEEQECEPRVRIPVSQRHIAEEYGDDLLF